MQANCNFPWMLSNSLIEMYCFVLNSNNNVMILSHLSVDNCIVVWIPFRCHSNISFCVSYAPSLSIFLGEICGLIMLLVPSSNGKAFLMAYNMHLVSLFNLSLSVLWINAKKSSFFVNFSMEDKMSAFG